MIKPETKRILEELGKSQYGRALVEFLHDQKETLLGERYTTLEEYLARDKTVDIVDKLFDFLSERPKNPEKSKVQYK